jgi:hypothetical protein
VIDLDAASVLLQWATGGLFFLWVTTRKGVVGPGYGWLLRGIYLALALLALWVGVSVIETEPVRELSSLGVALAAAVALVVSVRRKAPGSFPAVLDLVPVPIGVVGLVAAGLVAGGPDWLAVSRLLVGAAFLGSVTDAMLLGHWYLVQPGLPRSLLIEQVRWLTILWFPEVALLLVPTGMVSVLNGSIDDGYGGLLGWFWAACAVTTIGLCIVTRKALDEPSYSAVMAATGLLYLAILTAFGTDLVARAVLA